MGLMGRQTRHNLSLSQIPHLVSDLYSKRVGLFPLAARLIIDWVLSAIWLAASYWLFLLLWPLNLFSRKGK